jgi:hypothetical protein
VWAKGFVALPATTDKTSGFCFVLSRTPSTKPSSRVEYHTVALLSFVSWYGTAKRKKSYPGNRSRTSDLEISIVAIYSLPLCQLSYTRTYFLIALHSEQESLLGSQGASKKVDHLRTVGIEPTLLRTRALSVRLNRSAKSAIIHEMASPNFHVLANKADMTSWRNGNASDSRPEDWGFDSL